MATRKIPRGIRNNNQLNVRVGNNWLGEVANPTDNVFEQFQTMYYGCRAAFIILRTYIVRHKIKTIDGIIRRWAPSNENNTEAYILHVCRVTGMGSKDKLAFLDHDRMIKLFNAMCLVECGQTVDQLAVEMAYDTASKALYYQQ